MVGAGQWQRPMGVLRRRVGPWAIAFAQRVDAGPCRNKSIDANWVSAFGFSAEAYAITEVMEGGWGPKLRAIVLGGLHGHGQSGLDGSRSRGTKFSSIVTKWDAYLKRLQHHSAPQMLIGVHHEHDKVSPWRYASQINDEIDAARRKYGLMPSDVQWVKDMPPSKKNKACLRW